jgi:hypothetical protein
VRVPLELLLSRRDDAGMRVADVQAADAAREVDERVAVEVGERRALRLRDDDRKGQGERVGVTMLALGLRRRRLAWKPPRQGRRVTIRPWRRGRATRRY